MQTETAISMIDLTGVTHHPALESIVEVLCNKTQNTDRGFFRTEVAYFLGKIASNMRATIVTKDRGEIPVNIYALALATSGFGKGHSVNIIENEFMRGYKKRFMEETMPVIAEKSLWNIANERAARNGSDLNDEFEKAEGEYRRAGAFPFTFDSGTAPAVKQLRTKLLISDIGAINLQIDEIGSNLVNNIEVLTLYLELYDQGIVKQKLTKNTAESSRAEEMDGKTPANMLLFGTPAKLLDGGAVEDQFYSFLDTGYARRCLFGWGQHDRKAFNTQTPEEIYNKLIEPSNNAAMQQWAAQFHRLADPAMYNWLMTVEHEVGVKLVEYKINCERAADQMADHEEIRKAEMSHRYFKALKLAGAYAFVDESNEVEMSHLLSAILLVEESGAAFQKILTREKAYMKLAKYIAAVDGDVTHADLNEALPFYKSGQAARNEIMTMATAWGYKKHIIIKKKFDSGIEFFQGETLKETDLDKIRVSYSDNWAYNYEGVEAPFDQLHLMTQGEDENGGPIHWVNHHFKGGHRATENIIPGFNCIVIDVDHGIPIKTAHELLAGYKFMTYTTKRHQTEGHGDRYRIILPINYTLELDTEDYRKFMNGVLSWLPFDEPTDDASEQIAKKWESFSGGSYHYNLEGEIFDALPFIPRTSRNEDFQKEFAKVESMDNLERWFAQRMASGNRNKQMIKYALALVDSGMDLVSVSKQVHAFNAKLVNGLPEDEINTTILATVAKRLNN
ncbi:putative DNA primase [Erwinia phage vB_EamP_Rexella]|uniref:Putative DNA primase n=1 Tax=Erwinia phage vB_EamP_Rexella TaxID=1852642 RepID=A0A1Z2XXA9_9CAUD|nr:putative DNA primase [Erwinia phage vB_EamP_Rexella]